MISIRAATDQDDETIADLAFEYLSWAIARLREEYGVVWPPIARDDVRASVAAYRAEGAVFLASHGDDPVGIGALRWLADGVAEIKRMYVRERARGMHAGSRLLDELLRLATDGGATVIRLDTIKFMNDAQRLYRARGFTERSRYEGSEIPDELGSHWLYFERSIGSTTAE